MSSIQLKYVAEIKELENDEKVKRYIELSSKRKEIRARRLSLKPDFDDWYADSVCLNNILH